MRRIITPLLLTSFFLLIFNVDNYAQVPGSGQIPIDPYSIPQFVDPLPHFAGNRVDIKSGGRLIVKAVPAKQIALSTGTVVDNGIIGITPGAGVGNYFTYSISKDRGKTWTPPLWPAFTIETYRGKPVHVTYRNELWGQTYDSVNVVVDQSITWASPMVTGDPMMDRYTGPVPIVVHLHGGEVQSTEDGGPNAWFTPGYQLKGSSFNEGVDSIYTYLNKQEPATLWFHDHVMGATRTGVYAGMAGFYFLRGRDEEIKRLPGWSGDDYVQEVAPAGKSGVFNPKPYLPEIELAIQDRMFDTKGQLYWPLDPPNPDIHPFWNPEFFGDVMTVNGKSWPYLSVAPRKYRFRVLDGCNARFLDMWLQNLETGSTANAPVIYQIGVDGGFLDTTIRISPGKIYLAPGERADIVIDFSKCAPGSTWTLMNDEPTPAPDGDDVIPGLTDRIMQFVVNGKMRASEHNLKCYPYKKHGMDMSWLVRRLRDNPIVRLTNFYGKTNITPKVVRQLTLNEYVTEDGPTLILLNNSRFDTTCNMTEMNQFGEVTENPVEGTVEIWQIINLTMDAHPIHLHLVTFQLVNRQGFDEMAYMEAYDQAFDMGMMMAGEGPPNPYDVKNSDGAVGGNPSIKPFLIGNPTFPLPEERGWKDTYKVFPGQIATFIVRFAPTDLSLHYGFEKWKFAFDPSVGPGYVWHCHIVDHEDNEMMRPYKVKPSKYRSHKKSVEFEPEFAVAPVPMDKVFSLGQNSPNPCSIETEIAFSLPSDEHVLVTLYNLEGKKISEILNANAPAGLNKIVLDVSSLKNGVYIYELKTNKYSEIKKLVVAR